MMRNLKIFLAIISIIVVFVLANFLVAYILPLLPWSFSSDMTMFVSYCSSFFITIIWAVLGGKYIFGLYIPNLKPEVKKVSPSLIVGGLILILAMNIIISPLVKMMPKEYLDLLDGYIQGGLWAMITAVVMAPILEEFLFRGIIQRNIQRMGGAITGIVFSSLIFGIIHIIPQQVVGATAAGLVLGSMYYVTGSLNSVIAIHILNNGFSYLMYWVFGSNHNGEINILGDGTLFFVLYLISLILVILSAYALLNVVRGRAAWRKKKDFKASSLQ